MGDTCDIKQVTFSSPSHLKLFELTTCLHISRFYVKDPPHTRQSTPTLAAFLPWGSSARCLLAEDLVGIIVCAPITFTLSIIRRWRIRIAAECARLESVYRETYRGFKSLILHSIHSLQMKQALMSSQICLEPLPSNEFTSSDILRS